MKSMNRSKLQIIGLSLFLIFFFVIGIFRGILSPRTPQNQKTTETPETQTETTPSTQTGNNFLPGDDDLAPLSSLEDLSSLQTPTPYPSDSKPQLKTNEEDLFTSDVYQVTYYPEAKLYSIIILKNPYETYKKEALSKVDELIGKPGQNLCGLTIQIGAPRYVSYDASIHPTTVNVCQ